MAASFKLNYRGVGEMLNAEWMVEEMHRRADAGRDFAVTISPVSARSTDGSHYVEGFKTSAGTHGGHEHDRAYGRLENSDAAALWVELGSTHNQAHHILGKSADIMGSE